MTYERFVTVGTFGVLALSVATIFLFALAPETSDRLAYEDYVVEDATAMMAILSSFMLIGLAVIFFLSRSITRGCFALLLGLSFFVVGMEEVSWMQRTLNIESSQFFIDNNMQGETNLHNINTPLTMALFYLATFFVFVIAPLFRVQIASLLQKMRLKDLDIFIPSDWIPITYIASVSFSSSTPLFRLDSIIIWLLTVAILAYYALTKTPQFKRQKVLAFVVVAVLIFGSVITRLIDYEAIGVRGWFPQEYREFFICLAVFFYSTDLALRVRRLAGKNVIDKFSVEK